MLKDAILANSVYGTGTPDFANTSCTNGSNINSSGTTSNSGNCGEETVGLYEETTSKGTTYYFRGDVEDNYVEFAGFYWRIIRVNEDGSVRLIYSGEKSEVDTAGKETVLANGYNDENTDYTQIQTSVFNRSYNRGEHVGYTYSEGYQRPSLAPDTEEEQDSTIKGVLDNWYSTNIGNNPDYDSKVVSSSGFCNDREVGSSYTWSSQPTSVIDYNGQRRMWNYSPSFDCSNANDLYQVKIGLITADEIIYAGQEYYSSNYGYYLYTGNYYWTMTPSHTNNGGNAHVFYMQNNGRINFGNGVVNSTPGVRPVINLSADVTISSGNGTISSPYVV